MFWSQGDEEDDDESEVDLNCKLCNKWFTYTAPDKASLKEHYATIHKGEKIPKETEPDYESMFEKVFKCIHCPKGKMFTHTSSHSLKMHMKITHRNIFIQDKLTEKEDLPTTLSCGMCKNSGKFFYILRKEDMIDHIKTEHKN